MDNGRVLEIEARVKIRPQHLHERVRRVSVNKRMAAKREK
jgi:hypothetical protein